MRIPLLTGAIALGSLLSGCTWPTWVTNTVKQVELKLSGPVQTTPSTLFNSVGFADVLNRVVYFDTECAGDGVCIQRTDTEWWKTHEYGHVAYWQLGRPFGADPASNERGAQCVAEVVLHRSVTVSPVEQYWDCPPSYITQLRRLMVSAGMLDEQRALVS